MVAVSLQSLFSGAFYTKGSFFYNRKSCMNACAESERVKEKVMSQAWRNTTE